MKRTLHNFLAVACTLLLLAQAQVSANTRQGPQAPAFRAQYAATPRAANPHTERARYAQREASDRGKSGSNGKRESTRPPADAQPPAISRNEAADIAQRATGGRVLSVRDNGRYWQVKVLIDDQRVRFVNVDMRSGRVR